jgi:hypothetical protein
MLIRPCTPADAEQICEVVNDAAVAYRGVIAPDLGKALLQHVTALTTRPIARWPE